jgi:hypothetical protein
VDAMLRTGLLPGANATRSFWIRQDDVLVFRASSGEDALERTIDDYVTVNGGGHVRVTVQPDQAVLIARVVPHERTLLDRIRDVETWRGRSLCKPLQPTALGCILGLAAAEAETLGLNSKHLARSNDLDGGDRGRDKRDEILEGIACAAEHDYTKLPL